MNHATINEFQVSGERKRVAMIPVTTLEDFAASMPKEFQERLDSAIFNSIEVEFIDDTSTGFFLTKQAIE
ncbi:MAG: hypothetical protein V3V49_04290 [Candidatus Krumholzibacteria bacterium]